MDQTLNSDHFSQKRRHFVIAGVPLRAIAGGLLLVGLGALFVASGISKLRHPYIFLAAVYSYNLLGPKSAVTVAAIVPWLELIVGICLIARVLPGGALLGAMLLGLMFTAAIGFALHQRLDINCGCFGAEEDRITYVSLARSLGVVIASIFACFLTAGSRLPLTIAADGEG